MIHGSDLYLDEALRLVNNPPHPVPTNPKDDALRLYYEVISCVQHSALDYVWDEPPTSTLGQALHARWRERGYQRDLSADAELCHWVSPTALVGFINKGR